MLYVGGIQQQTNRQTKNLSTDLVKRDLSELCHKAYLQDTQGLSFDLTTASTSMTSTSKPPPDRTMIETDECFETNHVQHGEGTR